MHIRPRQPSIISIACCVTLTALLLPTRTASIADSTRGTGASQQAQANVTTGAAALTTTREIRIDGNTEDLVRVTWVRVATDGRIAFGQFDDRQVRFYDSNGKAIGKFGRAGDGPGEFRSLSAAGWLGDSLFVFDVLAGRLTVIPRSLGKPRVQESGRRAFMPSVDGKKPVIGAGRIEGITRGGAILFSGLPLADSIVKTLSPPFIGLERAFVRAASERGYDAFLGGVVDRPGNRMSVGEATVSQPFPTQSVTAGMHDGSRFVLVVPSVEGRDAGTFLVTSIGLRGDTIFSRRLPFRLDRIPPAEGQKAIDRTAATLQRMGRNAESFRARAKVPPAYTPFARVIMGRDGSTWIMERSSDSRSRPWLVLDAQGNVYGRVTLDASASIEEADLNTIWVVEVDANDLPSIVRYRVTRRG